MASLVSSANGNFTASGTWSVADATSFLNSETNSTATTTSFVSSSAFTPGAITIDGIGVKLLSRTSAATGTFSVRLAQAGVAVAGTTVTTNAAAFAFYGNILGWAFFKFSAPVTLAAATAYTVQVQSSVAATVTVYRDATAANWSRFLRTTTNAAPAAADYLIVCGEQTGAGTFNTITVTMDNTAATNFSGGLEISTNGTLAYGTSASTAYQLRLSNNLLLNGGGTLTIGTSGTPIPSTSSAALEFIVASNVQFGLQQRGDSVFTTFGATKTGRAFLAADASAAATTITTDVSTNWLSGDSIVIASTTQTVAQTEQVTLSANAAGTSVSVSALGFAHSGTSPTRAEIMNLTRNVKIFGQSVTLQSFIALQGTSTNSMNFTECYFMGSVTANKRGIDISSSIFGTNLLNGCSFRNFEVANSLGLNLTGGSNATVQDCVLYRINAISVRFSNTTDTTVSVTNTWAMSNILTGNNHFQFDTTAVGGSLTNCVGVSATGFGIAIASTDLIGTNFTVSGNSAHANNSGGISVTANVNSTDPATVSSTTVWRNANRGIAFNGASNFIFDGVTAFGNATANIAFITIGSAYITLKNMVLNAGTTLTSPIGILFQQIATGILVENSTFGATTTHATGDIDTSNNKAYLGVSLRNCLLNSTTKVSNLASTAYESFVASSRHQQTAGSFTMFKNQGTITKDAVIYDTTNPTSTASTRLTPSSASVKLSEVDKRIIVPSGKSLKVSVSVRRSVVGDGVAYNGALPRLCVKKNSAIGLTSDSVLATATAASSGAFEVISGTTSSATDNGVFSFIVDCDGTAGWVNVDRWKVEVV